MIAATAPLSESFSSSNFHLFGDQLSAPLLQKINKSIGKGLSHSIIINAHAISSDIFATMHKIPVRSSIPSANHNKPGTNPNLTLEGMKKGLALTINSPLQDEKLKAISETGPFSVFSRCKVWLEHIEGLPSRRSFPTNF
eukprot:TRINITY_DN139838_c0_g1_i1.p3 TRINITY_DN139838_c0_g1~~TRINITY_DN139838_c0_g1_i1.p3  ORF type:complete len:140 (-),score=5.10 TRINITY_DN139838_c0_g1_i1:358-777(-)